MKLVVFASGNGSNLQAILDACATGQLPANNQLPAQVVAVISNKADAFALERAKRAQVPAICKTWDKNQARTAYDNMLADCAAGYQPDWIVLAGWMHLLSHTFLRRFPNRVVNLHPALPGMFPGTRAIDRAYRAFQKKEIQHTGVMVHLVPDESIDDGPVLAQQVVPIEPQDTLAQLTERVHACERTLLIQVLQSFAVLQNFAP